MTTLDTADKEISLADTQLGEHGLNTPRVFSYPYGLSSNIASQILTKYGYSLAFTPVSGSTLCQKQRLQLPRIRIGNTNLDAYGF